MSGRSSSVKQFTNPLCRFPGYDIPCRKGAAKRTTTFLLMEHRCFLCFHWFLGTMASQRPPSSVSRPMSRGAVAAGVGRPPTGVRPPPTAIRVSPGVRPSNHRFLKSYVCFGFCMGCLEQRSYIWT